MTNEEKKLAAGIEPTNEIGMKLGIFMQNISVWIDEDEAVKVFIEVTPVKGDKLLQDLDIICVFYDNEGSIISKESSGLYKDEFLAFDVVEFSNFEEGLAGKIARARIYPKVL